MNTPHTTAIRQAEAEALAAEAARIRASVGDEWKSTPCNIWPGNINPKGYGKVWSNGKMRYAHRVAYEKAKGAIPDGFVIDHLCRNHACVNPHHLEAVPMRVNLLRGMSHNAVVAASPFCKRGHKYDSVRVTYGKREGRICQQCHNEGQRKRYWARRGVSVPPPHRWLSKRQPPTAHLSQSKGSAR